MKIYVDVTETFESQLNTGIQRVVRSIAHELKNADLKTKDLEVVAIASSRNDRSKGFALEESWLDYKMTSMAPDPRERVAYRISSTIWRYLELGPLRRWLHSATGLKLASLFINSLSRRDRAGKNSIEGISFKPGDVFLALDSFWGSDEGLKLAQSAQNVGCQVAFLIHDVIPLSHPELVDALNLRRFEKMAPLALEMSDLVFYPSFVTRDEINKHIPGALNGKPHLKLKFGHDGVVARNKGAGLPASTERITGSIFMLGTIEPRKNHEMVFDWYLKNERHSARFTIIGKAGWLTRGLQKRMRLEDQNNPLFTWHENADDDLLLFEMSRHEVGIIASHAEGFGLPVVEMNLAGLKLALSDIPIFREVAPSSSAFFSPTSEVELEFAIQRAREQLTPSVVGTVTWAETSAQVVQALKGILAKPAFEEVENL